MNLNEIVQALSRVYPDKRINVSFGASKPSNSLVITQEYYLYIGDVAMKEGITKVELDQYVEDLVGASV